MAGAALANPALSVFSVGLALQWTFGPFPGTASLAEGPLRRAESSSGWAALHGLERIQG